MTTQIDWGDGSGDKITLTYTAASGNQTVLVSSAAYTGDSSRSKDITFSVTAGGTTISRVLTVRQSSGNVLTIITRNDTAISHSSTAVGYQ